MQPPFGLETEPRLVAIEPSFLAVYKPCRLHSAALPGQGGASLASWVFERFPETGPRILEGEGEAIPRLPEEGGLVHRLDFETSGLVLFARSGKALRHFLAAQAEGGLAKTYRALCSPSTAGLPGSRPLIGRPSGLDEESWRSALAAALDPAKAEAGREELGSLLPRRSIESRFRPFGPAAGRVACLAPEALDPKPRRRGSPARVYGSLVLGLRPEAGRPEAGRPEAGRPEAGRLEAPWLEARIRILLGFRHQIRAHFAWIGLPLLGDNLYGGAEAERLCLHAESLEFAHPDSGLPYKVEC